MIIFREADGRIATLKTGGYAAFTCKFRKTLYARNKTEDGAIMALERLVRWYYCRYPIPGLR